MDSVSSRELKNRTAAILRRVRAGERVTVTNRGRPVAVIVPIDQVESFEGQSGIRPFEEAWTDIEAALADSEPRFETWQQAMDATRRRR